MKKKILLAALLIVLVGNLQSQIFPNPATLSTGQGAPGTIDPIWIVSPWYTSSPPNPMGLTYITALINNNCAPGSWVNPASLPPPVNNGNWITGSDGAQCTGIVGYRYFRLTLNLPADCNGNSVATPGNYVLYFSGYVDNGISDVFINGNSTGISGGTFSAGGQLNMTLVGPWVPGINYVDILVYNGGGPYGLLLVANSTASSVADGDNDGTSDINDQCPCQAGSMTNGCPAAIVGDTIICKGGSTTLTSTGSGTYLWNTGSTNVSINVNPASTTRYSVKVTTSTGFIDSTAVNVTVRSLPTATITGTAAICKDAAAPDITFTGASGTPPYIFTYTVNGGANQTVSTTGGNSVVTVSAPTIAAGVFTYALISVQESSSLACSQAQSGSAIVTVLPLPTATIAGTRTICQNDAFNIPLITFTGANGATPYTFNYSINGGANQTVSTTGGNSVVTVHATVTTVGTFMYDLASVSDGNSCSQAQSGMVTITVNPLPTATITGTIAVCDGAAAPNITFTGAGGTAPYTFTYTINSGANQTITTTSGNSVNLSAPTSTAGTFEYDLVSIQDASSSLCSQIVSGSAIITVNPLPTATIAGTTAVCKGAAAPNITFTGAAGTAPYTFTYKINGGTNQTVITNSGNSVIIAAPTTVAGAFVYSLVSVQDASSATCSQSQSGTATVTVNPLPTATITGTTTLCQNDPSPNITFTGANGTAPYTFNYLIPGGTSQSVSTISGNSVNVPISTAFPGPFTYTLVSVQDVSATTCSQTQSGSVTITVNPLPTAMIAGTITVCKGNTAPNITFTGGAGTLPYTFTYTINGGAHLTTSTSGGNSAVTMTAPTNAVGTFIYALVSVKDASSTACSQLQSGNATVTVNPLPTASIAGTTTVCENDPAPNITFTGAAGTAPYTITYTINSGTNQTVTTTGNNAVVPVPTGTAGAFTYSLVSVQDASATGCNQTQNGGATITINPVPIATIAGTAAVCKGDIAPQVVFTGAAGVSPYTFTYSINGGANHTINTSSGDTATITVSTSTAGTFIYNLVKVQDASITACSQMQNGSATITVNPLPTATITGTMTVCKNAPQPNITFTGAAGTAPYTFTYIINNGTNHTVTTIGNNANVPVATNIIGTYTYSLVSVRDASSTLCSQAQTGNATITVNSLPTATIAGTIAVCKNDVKPNVTFSGAAGTSPYTFTYTINSGTNQTISSIGSDSIVTIAVPTNTAGIFIYDLLSVHDASSTSCSQTQIGTATATVNPLPTASISGTSSVCKDATAPNITFTGAGSTAPYTFTYSINGGANQTISTIIGNSVTSSVSTGTAGTYIYSLISVKDASSTVCSQTQTGSATVTVNPKPIVSFTANDTSGCERLCINFFDLSSIATGHNALWLWNFGDGHSGSEPNHCYTNGSVYSTHYFNVTLTVTSDSGCVNSLIKNNYITVYPKPNASFKAMPDTTTIMDPVISILNLSAGATSSFWNFGNKDTSSIYNPVSHTYADTGKYTVTLVTSTQYGCKDTTKQTVIIEPDFAFFIPSTFTPNDDGINDTFTGKGVFISNYQMMIFDRWGNLIFFTNDINKPWDGKANYGTQIAQTDVYVYTIKLTDINRKVHNYKGIVKLLR